MTSIMVKSCSAFNCKQRYQKNIKFHKFPLDSKLRKRWRIAIRRRNFIPTESAKICDKHFKDDDYYTNAFGNKVLKNGAIPSIIDRSKQLRKYLNARKQDRTKDVMDLCTPTMFVERLEDDSIEHLEESEESEDHLENSECLDKSDQLNQSEEELELEHLDKSKEQLEESVESMPILIEKSRNIDPVKLEDFSEEDLNNPTNRHLYWMLSQNTIELMIDSNRYLQSIVGKQVEEIESLNSLIKDLRRQLYGLKEV